MNPAGDVGSTLLIASAGGHLKQLHTLAERFCGVGTRFIWVTFDTLQSRSLLAGREVVYVRPIHPRQAPPALLNMLTIDWVLRNWDITDAVSTGAGVALSAFVPARSRGVRCHYIESAARATGPSLTGRMLSATPGVRLYAQYRGWAGRRWRYRGSVFDGFVVRERPTTPTISRVVVTLGTERYGFRRVIERLLSLLPSGTEVLWQTGSTDTTGLPIDATAALPSSELDSAMRAADLIVAHAGVGSALAALEAGHTPILVPRRRERGEHIDDHQEQVGAELAGRGLVITREADQLEAEDLTRAAARMVEPAAMNPVFPLHLG